MALKHPFSVSVEVYVLGVKCLCVLIKDVMIMYIHPFKYLLEKGYWQHEAKGETHLNIV